MTYRQTKPPQQPPRLPRTMMQATIAVPALTRTGDDGISRELEDFHNTLMRTLELMGYNLNPEVGAKMVTRYDLLP